MLRMVSIPKGTKLLKTNSKNRLDCPSPQAKITPSNTPFFDPETLTFAEQLKAICYNAVIFLMLARYCVIEATYILYAEGDMAEKLILSCFLSKETTVLTSEEGKQDRKRGPLHPINRRPARKLDHEQLIQP